MTDLTVKIYKGKTPCQHILIEVYKNAIKIGQETVSLDDLKSELDNYDCEKDQLIAQIRAIIIANKNKTMAQIKQAVEAVTYRV